MATGVLAQTADLADSPVLAQAAERVPQPAIDWAGIAPLLVIFGAACVGVLIESFLPRSQRWSAQVTVTLLAIVVATGSVVMYARDGAATSPTLSDTLVVDAPTLFLWGTLLVLSLAAVLLIADRSVEQGGAFIAESNPEQHPAGAGGPGAMSRVEASQVGMRTEVFPLALFSLGGMMVFLAANDLLTMFVALEVLSLPLYVLCALAKRRRLLSQEASVKYFLLGAFASGFFLYGLALLYGYAGSVRLAAISEATASTARSDTLLFAGLGMLIVGLLFKASVGPFHTWTPDVYQGAPTAVTAFMAACTKVAAFGAILRVLHVGFEASRWQWQGVLWAVAIVSMVIGVVVALAQHDIKRMIAYSSVAHAGFLLIGAITLTDQGLSATLFYLLAYGFTTIAVFGVMSLVRTGQGEASHLSEWDGLAKRSPLLAWVFTFLLLALAGIPLTSGFIGKFVVFTAAWEHGMAPLVMVALVASAAAAYFYLQVVVRMHLREPAADGPTVSVPGAFTTAAITLGVVVTLLLGVLPTLALEWANVGGFVS